ncbi:uncharacterized protein EV154DRAFT_531163 [Mucor mucedo]|uniref:uncharacterized protein n=1 Tax=Mucor mucedo TaxID=29922 RepID=UPI0022208140|nr:uncharacterized protein EV154DRAFT_531163 [Mucor mucedo]KAI7868687.1 hypothetical protein EV154DRAFT_531163 [Mucor mucedo]
MDFNKILSLLKGQDIVTPNVAPPAPAPAATATSVEAPALSSGLDLSNISQSVIDQVRNEYLTKKKSEDKLKNATTITPEVLVTIGKMVQETDLVKVLKKCKERQDNKEKELYSHRESIKARYSKQKESILAKQLIGVKSNNPNELQMVEREMNQELHGLDLQIIKDMDKEVTYLQQEFVKLNVPLFKVTKDPNDIKLQQKVLFMLQDMI